MSSAQAIERDTFVLFTKGPGVTVFTASTLVTDAFAVASKPIQDDVVSWAAICSSDVSAFDAILWGSIDGVNFNVKVSEIKFADSGFSQNGTFGETIADTHTYCSHFQVQVTAFTGTNYKIGIRVK